MVDLILNFNYFGVLGLALDFTIVFVCIHFALKVIRNDVRNIQALKGIVVIFFLRELSNAFSLFAIGNLFNYLLIFAPFAVVSLFSSEIRQFLEKLGKLSTFNFGDLNHEHKKHAIQEIIDAVKELSSHQIGALIVIEGTTDISEHIKNGIRIDSLVKSELLENLFAPKTALHDGAVVLQKFQISYASAILPLSATKIKSKYGTRHRAALGISEVSDAFVIIVSEETGEISVAHKSRLERVEIKKLSMQLASFWGLVSAHTKKRAKVAPASVQTEILDDQTEVEIYYQEEGGSHGRK